jgi:hypothetical protein
MSCNLTVAAKRESVVPLPSCSSRRSCLVMPVSLSTETSVFLPSRGESSKFSVLVNRFADPRDPWVIADRIVGRINHDNLIVFVSRILPKKKWN